MNINDFNDILHTRIIRLMTEITGLPDNLIINVKNNRGAFPQKVIKNPRSYWKNGNYISTF